MPTPLSLLFLLYFVVFCSSINSNRHIVSECVHIDVSLYSSNTILHYSFCVNYSVVYTFGSHNVAQVVLAVVILIVCSLVVLNGSLRVVVNCLVLLLLSWIHLISALMFFHKARIKQDHALVHNL